MSRTYFGTDGVRGKVGESPITPDFVLRLGYAAGRVLVQNAGLRGAKGEHPAVLIGKDTRVSGYMLEAALESGFAAAVLFQEGKLLTVGRQRTPVERPEPVSFPVRAARRDLYANAINEALIATPGIWLARFLVYVDNRGVDGVVNGTAALLGGSSGRLRRLQTGFVRSYALTMLGGAVLVVAGLLAVRFV
jgi:NADH-quinone oxidoreductase subunit L